MDGFALLLANVLHSAPVLCVLGGWGRAEDETLQIFTTRITKISVFSVGGFVSHSCSNRDFWATYEFVRNLAKIKRSVSIRPRHTLKKVDKMYSSAGGKCFG